MVWRSSIVSSLLFVTPGVIVGPGLGVFPLVFGTGDLVVEVYALMLAWPCW